MNQVSRLHTSIQVELSAAAGTANRNQSTNRYTGSTHTFYAVPIPVRRQIIKQLVRLHAHLPDQEWLELADALFHGESHEEKTMGAIVLKCRPQVRGLVAHRQLRGWLEELVGWAEVDALCFNIYTATEFLENWPRWEKFLYTCARSKNANVRRSALVLLCGPVARSADARLHECAFTLTKSLAADSSILITKAISWLLRCQIDTCKAAVHDFVVVHESTLPRFVMREVTRKLETGKKNT